MPVHRIPSGPDQDDVDVMESAIAKLEKHGEEILQVMTNWLDYPVGQLVVITRKRARTERRTA